ncbi:MAG: hypothetical protein ABI439_07045 [Rhodospirillales bacterium]
MLIEDCAGLADLSATAASIAASAPEHTFLIASAAKSISVAVSVGYVVAPPGWGERFELQIRDRYFQVAPMGAEIMTHLIDGDAVSEIAAAYARPSPAGSRCCARHCRRPGSNPIRAPSSSGSRCPRAGDRRISTHLRPERRYSGCRRQFNRRHNHERAGGPAVADRHGPRRGFRRRPEAREDANGRRVFSAEAII